MMNAKATRLLKDWTSGVSDIRWLEFEVCVDSKRYWANGRLRHGKVVLDKLIREGGVRQASRSFRTQIETQLQGDFARLISVNDSKPEV